MKKYEILRVSIYLGFALILTSCQSFEIQKADKVFMRMYNIDDEGICEINASQTFQFNYEEDSGWIDITNFLNKDHNLVGFTFNNTKCCLASYGYMLRVNEKVIVDEKMNFQDNEVPKGRIIYKLYTLDKK